MKKGFTLIELLAVIVILAIVLVIAVPNILSTIETARKGAFESDAKLVVDAIKNETIKEGYFDVTSINKDNITELLNLSNANYGLVTVLTHNDEINVVLVGQGKWDGYTAYGTFNDMNVTKNTGNGSPLLLGLTTSVGTLSPSFNESTFTYDLVVPTDTTSVDIAPTIGDSFSIIDVNGKLHNTGENYVYTFNGETSAVLNVRVTSITGDENISNTYTLNISKGPNVNLSSLALTGGYSISPSYSASQTAYTASVPYSTSSVAVTLATADSNAVIRINGVMVIGTSSAISLNAGAVTQIFIRVSNGGVNKDYTIDVTRPSS